MNTQKGFAVIPVLLILAVLIGGGVYLSAQKDDAMIEGEMLSEADVAQMMAAKEEAMMEKQEGAMMKKEEGAMMEGAMHQDKVLAGIKAQLLDFTKADYDKALASGKLVALYFYADWCPVCRAEFPKMQSAFNKLTTDGVIGFRVNYKDNFTDADETALAKQFGVAYQHTKVFIKNGTQVLKSPESWDEARYLAEIGKLTQ